MDLWKQTEQLEKRQTDCKENVQPKLKNIVKRYQEESRDRKPARDAPKNEKKRSPVKGPKRTKKIPQLQRNKATDNKITIKTEKNTATTNITSEYNVVSTKLREIKKEIDAPRKGHVTEKGTCQKEMQNANSTTKEPRQTSAMKVETESSSKVKVLVENTNYTKNLNQSLKIRTKANDKNNSISKQSIKKSNTATAPVVIAKRRFIGKIKTEKKEENKISSKAKNNTPQRSKMQPQTSALKKTISGTSSSQEKKTVAKRLSTANSTNSSISTRPACSKTLNSGDQFSGKNLNNQQTVKFEKLEKKTEFVDQRNEAEVEFKKLIPKTTKELSQSQPRITVVVRNHSRNSEEHTKSEEKRSTDKREIGKFEKKLLEKEERRRKRQQERREKRIERVMLKFSSRIVKVMQQMAHSQENESSSDSSDSSFSSSSGDSSYSSSSSWYSCSCSSCSCSYSESSDYDSYPSSCSCSCTFCNSSFSESN